MGTNYVVGIDPHAYNIKAVLFDVSNRLAEVERFHLEQTEEDFKKLHSVTYSHTKGNVVYCTEDNNGFGKEITRFLLSSNATVFHVPSSYTHEYKKKTPHIEKSDFLDCKYIAQAYLVETNIKQLRLNFEEDYYEELNDLSFQRWRLGQEKGDIKKRIGIRLYKYFGATYKKVFINKFWSNAIVKELEEVFKDKNEPEALIIKMFISDLNRTEEKIQQLDKILEKLANDEVKQLCEIKGVGFLIASRLVAVVKKGYNPKNVRSLSKRAGIAPIQDSTGGVMSHRCNHRGHRHLNHLIHQICTTKVKGCCNDKQTRDYYQKRLRAGDSKDVAFKKVKNVVSREILRKLFPNITKGVQPID